MNRLLLTISAITSCLFPLNGQGLSGVVVNKANEAVSGAKITLSGLNIYLYSDSSGRFFLDAVGARHTGRNPSPFQGLGYSLHGGDFVLSIAGTARNLSLQVFDLNGRQLENRQYRRLSGQIHPRLSSLSSARNVRLVRIVVDGISSIKRINVPGAPGDPTPDEKPDVTSMGKKQGRPVNLLTVEAEGYETARIPVESYSGFHTIVLESAGGPVFTWPNDSGRANSDPWLIRNHRGIKKLKPRILALNFVNNRSMKDMHDQFVRMIDVLAEASRHTAPGITSKEGMLQYELSYEIDMRDTAVAAGYPYSNSSLYPRENPKEGYWGFDYEALFTSDYARHYGIKNPRAPGTYLTLCELFEMGLVNEVWVFGDADNSSDAPCNAAEILEMKPWYDVNGNRLRKGMTRCAGNGCFDEEDAVPCSVTVRVGWFNNTRGPGCFLESLAHGFESMASGGAVPYLKSYFKPFANMTLDVSYGLPFESWYGAPYNTDVLDYSQPYQHSTAVRYNLGGTSGIINDYNPVCGNVHWAPNGRRHYDLTSPDTVWTSCEYFCNPQAPSAREPFSINSFSRYNDFAADCMGPFLVWWFQRMPGPLSNARDQDSQPMKSWLPFIYY